MLSIVVCGWDIFCIKSYYFSAQLVCSENVGFVSLRKFCSVVADLKYKCVACLLGMNFYRDMKVYVI